MLMNDHNLQISNGGSLPTSVLEGTLKQQRGQLVACNWTPLLISTRAHIYMYPECDIVSSQAHDFAVDLDELQSTLKSEISIVQQHYQKSTNIC